MGSLAQIGDPGDIVRRALRQRQLDSWSSARSGASRAKWRGDLGLVDDAVQPVAAQQEDVARLDLAVGAVDLDLLPHADGAREDMAHRMAERLLGRHQPARRPSPGPGYGRGSAGRACRRAADRRGCRRPRGSRSARPRRSARRRSSPSACRASGASATICAIGGEDRLRRRRAAASNPGEVDPAELARRSGRTPIRRPHGRPCRRRPPTGRRVAGEIAVLIVGCGRGLHGCATSFRSGSRCGGRRRGLRLGRRRGCGRPQATGGSWAAILP